MQLGGRVALAALGALLRLVHPFVRKDPGLWVFGSLGGTRFVDNPKYLFLHVLAEHPGTRAVWIAQSPRALAEARAAGGVAMHNLSPRGLWNVLRAANLVISTKRSDVLYFFPSRGRHVFSLHHGMPIKKILHDYDGPLRREADAPLLDAVWTALVVGFRWSNVDAVVCTSPFYREILRSAYQTERVFVTGQPRTDPFGGVDKEEVRWRLGLGDAFVVAYMPTHRAFGRGATSPIPFVGDPIRIDALRSRNVRFAFKLHPSMLAAAGVAPPPGADDVLVDLSVRCQDPQELLAVADCLVTDYSSAYIDFLLLDRPIVFYLYDEEEYLRADNPVYFRLSDRPCGPIVRDEEALLDAILAASDGRDPLAPQRHAELEAFHTYRDAGSSVRVWNLLLALAAGGPAVSGRQLAGGSAPERPAAGSAG